MPDRPSVLRHLEIDLAALTEGREGAWRVRERGEAAPEALVLGLESLAGGAALAVAVGSGVRRGIPTAARATVVARVPTTGRVADGQIGGQLGARLAGRADLVTLSGASSPEAQLAGRGVGNVLFVDFERDRAPRVTLEAVEGLASAPATEIGALVRARFGASVSGLAVGRAGRAGAPLANVAGLDEPTSFVGRGGLGVAFGALGIVAFVVRGPAVERPTDPAAARALRSALERSPRLVARAEGGTFELAGELTAAGAEGAPAARRAAAAAAESKVGRHGCKGCPTPCGWVLDGGDGRVGVRGARFGALAHLAGPASKERGDPRRLLARCDDLGLDAKGAAFAFARLGPRVTVDELARGAYRAEQMAAVFESRAPDRTDGTLERLARFVAGPGRDPMRVGLALAGQDPARAARLMAPLPTPAAGAGLGRSVFWHECFAAALDAVGFCAFSAAGLVADGLQDVDELARTLLPPAPSGEPADAQRLLELGARIVRLRHLLAPGRIATEASGDLAQCDALPEYRLCAGLDEEGRPVVGEGTFGEAVRRLLSTAATVRPGRAEEPLEVVAPARVELGRVELRASGALAARFGVVPELELALPAALGRVLEAAERRAPGAAGWLVREGSPVPAVHRAGVRLDANSVIHDGDVLDLVWVVSGG